METSTGFMPAGPERDAYILRRRAEGATFQQIANEICISRERVRLTYLRLARS